MKKTKKIISVLFTLLMMLSVFSVINVVSYADNDQTENEYSLGDVNNDGKITAADARTILRAAARLETLTDVQSLAADIDKNGKVTASDARIALRISAKLDSIDNYLNNEPPAENVTVCDLLQYHKCKIDAVEADFGELEFFTENRDVAAHYYYEGIYFFVDKSDVIFSIDLRQDNGYEIHSIAVGDSYDDVSEMLAASGFKCSGIGKEVIFANNNSGGFSLVITFDDFGVSAVRVDNL